MGIGDTVKFIDGLYADEEGTRYKVMKISDDLCLVNETEIVSVYSIVE